jgi:hypothetical protein
MNQEKEDSQRHGGFQGRKTIEKNPSVWRSLFDDPQKEIFVDSVNS